RKINEYYDYNLLIIISGCVSEMIGDDIESVINNNKDKEILYINGAGFLNSYSKGFEKGLLSLVDLINSPSKTDDKKINIIGLENDSYLKSGDILEIKSLIGDDFDLNFLGSDCSVEDVRNSANARFNLVIDRGISLAEYMKEEFNISYKEIAYPYGMLGAFRLLEVIEEEFNLDYSFKKEEMKNQVKNQIEKVYGYLQSLYQMPAAVIASKNRAKGMKSFLEEELGFEVMNMKIKEDINLLEEFYNEILDTDVTVLFGSSFDKDFAFNEKIIYMPFDYPVFDRIDLTNKTYIGSNGSLNLIESLLNQIHVSKRKRGALYQ
ncbi:MAG TPA: nitrogenase component 1, partial [Tissierellaceae bacterium]